MDGERLPELNEAEQRALDFLDAHVHIGEPDNEYYTAALKPWAAVPVTERRPFWMRRTDTPELCTAAVDYGVLEESDERPYIFSVLGTVVFTESGGVNGHILDVEAVRIGEASSLAHIASIIDFIEQQGISRFN